MKNLNYYRRFFATLFGFIIFGVGGVALKLALLPYTLKSTQGDLPRQLKARRIIGASWRLFVRYLEWSGSHLKALKSSTALASWCWLTTRLY